MSDPTSFLSAADVADIHQTIRDASKTIQALQDPPVVVTFVDEHEVPVASNVHLIRIRLDDRDQSASGQGAIEEATRGTARAWEGDVQAVRQGHRFIWDQRTCVLTADPLPPRSGRVEMRFQVLGGKRP